MRILLPAIIVLFILNGTISGSEKVRIFIAGDSTAQTYDSTETTMRGWGQLLPLFITCPDIEVVNHAKAGRSTKSFRDEGRWAAIMDNVHPGDWVLIQFGHNDTSSKPERYSSPEDFRKNLIRFIEETQAKGAKPVLLTPIVMRTFIKGNLIDDRLKVYPGITREVSSSFNIPMVDVNLKTRDLILSLGEEKAKDLYVIDDDTHTNKAGAEAVAGFIYEGLKGIGILSNCD